MKYLILGAGPAGLAFANALLEKGETDFLVLEAEAEAGGLCRSALVDGSALDIGGGHFLDVRRPKVNEFLFRFMPQSEWNLYERDSRIDIHHKQIGHPFEANIWQLDVDEQVAYLKSIAAAGCNTGCEMPTDFVDWIYWKLGDKIAENYMIPYNRKMFGAQLNQLGTYWLEKLPNVSFEDTLRSCLLHKAYGQQPGHAQFYYPKKYGYGELWLRMARALGDRIEYGKQVKALNFDQGTIRTADGACYRAQKIITTIPWMEFDELNGMPAALRDAMPQLRFSALQVDYHAENLDTPAHWVYYPDPELSYHRILVRHNFCPGSRGYWTETNADRVDPVAAQTNFSYLNRYAYPLNTIGKPALMKQLLGWSREHGVYGLGRWGEHEHYNSDLTVELALALAEQLAGQ